MRAHAIEALNFQITWGIALIISVIISICTLFLLSFLPFIVWIVIIVFSVIGGVKANAGELYKYPMSIRLVK